MKILNLYSGIGGNRKLWKDCDVTAIEYNPKIANIYKTFFPNDTVIVADAHQYLLDHFKEFDFIWSSPPCPTHGSFRQNIDVRLRGTKPAYPDMRLYEEIILLQYNFKGIWVVENVRPYYTPLIKPSFILQRHFFWSSGIVPPKQFPKEYLRSNNKISEMEEVHGFDLSQFKIENKRQILRNCTSAEIGNYIYKTLTRH